MALPMVRLMMGPVRPQKPTSRSSFLSAPNIAATLHPRHRNSEAARYVRGVIDDPASGLFAAILIALSAPCYWWISRTVQVRAS